MQVLFLAELSLDHFEGISGNCWILRSSLLLWNISEKLELRSDQAPKGQLVKVGSFAMKREGFYLMRNSWMEDRGTEKFLIWEHCSF